VSTKKTGDQRRDDDASNEGFRVDRVFVDAPRASRPATQPTPQQPPRRAKPVTLPPRPVGEAADTELALRRQLSRLQRQLADAQRELANKDDELATEAENRLAITTEHDKLAAEVRARDQQLTELLAYQSRTATIERRLLDTTEQANSLSHERDEERQRLAAAQARVVELESALAEAQARWAAERTQLETQHSNEIGRLELERKAAAESAETQLAATTGRMQKAQEEQLAQLRESHEKSMALLRGELEPKALEARNLAEERSRLADEIEALKVDMVGRLSARDEAHARELAQQVESHSVGQAAAARVHAAEVARLTSERENLAAALEQAKRAAADRERLVDQTMTGLRESLKDLQREHAETKEGLSRLEIDNGSLSERLAAQYKLVEELEEMQRDLRSQLDTREREARQNALDRERFVAYLEEGMALLGALPPHETTGATAVETPSEKPNA
jgi:hypothetical protein